MIDPSHGQLDIKNKLIRTVFDNSFTEDPLRLLRAIQFSARLGFAIEPQTFDAMRTQAKLNKTVAKERIIIEIEKLLQAPIPIIGDIQRFLIEKVLDTPELNSKEALAKLIQENFKTPPAPS